jgi:Niemann-Pick C1 protein
LYICVCTSKIFFDLDKYDYENKISSHLLFFFFLAKENVNKLVFDPNDMSITDKLGMHFEIAMTNFFTDLGTLFARYPLPVIVLSVGFAVGLSTGIKWLNVTTDPIELWASPSSRSRIEKDFFDKTFRPFYRTEQIIITAKNLSSVGS